jgi:hypothetical protein
VAYVKERGAIHGFLNMVGSPAAGRTADRVSSFLREKAGVLA